MNTDEGVRVLDDLAPAAEASRGTPGGAAGPRSRSAFRAAFDDAPVGVALLDLGGRVTALNTAASVLLGAPAGALLGASLGGVLTDRDREAERRARVQLLAGEQGVVRARWVLAGPGSPVDVAASVLRAGGGEPSGFVVHLEDATERQQATDHLRRLALHDGLTGLPNRVLFSDRLGHALAGSRTESGGVALLFVDLDRFKEVNDAHGHEVGDALLVEVAARISSVLRPGDTAGRLGGDEFVVVCRDVADTAAAQAVLGRLAAALQPVLVLGDVRLQPRASVGLVLAGRGDDAETLLRAADEQMYRAKRSRRTPDRAPGRATDQATDRAADRAPDRAPPAPDGRGRRGPDDRSATGGRLWQRLATALTDGELRIAYQPLVDLATGAVVGAEALVRWQHPELGLLGPARFLPAAAETGIVVALDAWVLERACAEVAPLAAARGDGFVLCVNVAGCHLQRPGLLERVERALRSSGLPASALELELSGLAGAAAEGAPALRDLAALSERGVRLGLDEVDASLSAARVLPLDAVKLGRSLVRSLGEADEPRADLAVVAAAVALGRALGLRIGAAGVERPEQVSRLLALGCGVGQGYLLGRPGELAALG